MTGGWFTGAAVAGWAGPPPPSGKPVDSMRKLRCSSVVVVSFAYSPPSRCGEGHSRMLLSVSVKSKSVTKGAVLVATKRILPASSSLCLKAKPNGR